MSVRPIILGALPAPVPPRARRSLPVRGFTAIEISMVVAIAGILVAIALPAAARMNQNIRLENAAQQVARDLTRARSEAIKTNATVTFVRLDAVNYSFAGIARRLPEPVQFETTLTDTVRFAPFGPLLTGAGSFKVKLNQKLRTISLSAGGRVSVQ